METAEKRMKNYDPMLKLDNVITHKIFYEIEQIHERQEIKNIIEKRMKNYDPKNNVSWESIREDI
jgi:hypothetical protein